MTDSWRMHFGVRPGGLLRCCLQSLRENMDKRAEPPKEGDRLGCRFCKNVGGGMIFRDGAWEWANGA